MRKFMTVLAILLILFAGGYVELSKAAYSYGATQITNSMLNEPWTIEATTDNSDVKQVTFTFYCPPTSSSDPDQVIEVIATGNSPFYGTIYPDKPGEWRVFINFQDKNGGSLSSTWHYETLDSYSFRDRIPFHNVIPEIPVLGTGGAIIAMLMALIIVKKRNQAK